MGAWGAGIFEDDTACDVRDEFFELTARSRSVEDATAALVQAWGTPAFDPDLEPVFWFALAATQFRYGRLTVEVRDRAVELIDAGTDVEFFDDNRKLRTKRLAELAKLRSQLTGPQRKPRAFPRRERHENAWPVGAILTYRLSSGRIALFRVTRHHVDKGGRHAWIEVLAGTYEQVPGGLACAMTPGRRDRDGYPFELFVHAQDETSDRLALTDRGDFRFAEIASAMRKHARVSKRITAIITKPRTVDEILADFLDLV